MGTVSKLYVSNNTWIHVYIKKTLQNFNSNSNSREFQLQFQLQLREFQLQLQLQLRQISWISTPTPTPGVSTPTPTPTPANLQNINSNSNSNSAGFNSNSNSNSGVGVGVEPNSGVDPNPASIRSIRPSREDTVLLQWPGVAEGVIDSECIQLIQRQETAKRNRQVHLLMGGRNMNLYCDTGSRFTIIPPDLYKADMGEVIPARCHLRAWGADTHLDTKGMIRTTLVTSAGAKKATWVYAVGGTDPEPLLGDADAEDLGIIKFIPEGRPATAEELQNTVNQVQETSGSPRTPSGSIPAKLRRAGITVCSEKPTLPPVADTTYEECMATVQEYTGPVFTERTGHMKTSAITLQYDTGFQPMQPPRIPVPYHYRTVSRYTSRNWNLKTS